MTVFLYAPGPGLPVSVSARAEPAGPTERSPAAPTGDLFAEVPPGGDFLGVPHAALAALGSGEHPLPEVTGAES